jgi:hypothetical protein
MKKIDTAKRMKFSKQDIEKAFWPAIIAKSASEINKNLQMTTLQNQGQTGPQMQFQYTGPPLPINWTGQSVSWPIVGSGAFNTATVGGNFSGGNTVSWGCATGFAFIPGVVIDCAKIGSVQAKAVGPLSCKSCNTINEYAEPNQPNGTYICYNCK